MFLMMLLFPPLLLLLTLHWIHLLVLFLEFILWMLGIIILFLLLLLLLLRSEELRPMTSVALPEASNTRAPSSPLGQHIQFNSIQFEMGYEIDKGHCYGGTVVDDIEGNAIEGWKGLGVIQTTR